VLALLGGAGVVGVLLALAALLAGGFWLLSVVEMPDPEGEVRDGEAPTRGVYNPVPMAPGGGTREAERSRRPAPEGEAARASRPPSDREVDRNDDDDTVFRDGSEEPLYDGNRDKRPGSKEDVPRGSLSRQSIQKAIRAVVPRVQECYERSLETDPSLAGKVVVEFEIEGGDGDGGVVSRGEVPEAETFSPIFEACVLKEVAGARFPAPEGGGMVKVRYPFKFDPGGGFGAQEKSP
jgi:hypothetical protein